MYGQAAQRPFSSSVAPQAVATAYSRGAVTGGGGDLVNVLFSRASLGRHHKPTSQINPFFDQFLGTLNQSARLTDEEKRAKTGLREMVTNPALAQGGVVVPPRLWVFSTSELENELKLQVPRKIQAYVPPVATVPPVQSQKSKENVKKMRAANTTAGKVKRNLQVMDASHYVSDDVTTVGNTSVSIFDDVVGLPRKRTRLSSAGGGDGGGDGGDDDGDGWSGGGSAASALYPPLPKNFYDIINGIFQTFWSMEFPEEAVSLAFFAKIDSSNCTEYGLTSFSESPSGLAVIRDRMDASLLARQHEQYGGPAPGAYGIQPYRSVEDFYTDFRHMFDNVYRYFPADSPAQVTARELDVKFKVTWAAAKSAFKY